MSLHVQYGSIRCSAVTSEKGGSGAGAGDGDGDGDDGMGSCFLFGGTESRLR